MSMNLKLNKDVNRARLKKKIGTEETKTMFHIFLQFWKELNKQKKKRKKNLAQFPIYFLCFGSDAGMQYCNNLKHTAKVVNK